MADTLLSGVTLVEKESRSAGDIAIGGIIEFDSTYTNLPDGFLYCDGSTVNDPLSVYNGATLSDLNTNYWSCVGLNFKSNDSTKETNSTAERGLIGMNTSNNATMSAPVSLPVGAVVTSATVFGSAAADVWKLMRKTHAGTGVGDTLATANINSADTTISTATIVNETHSYFFSLSDIAQEQIIYGATITYTPRYKFIIRIK